MKTFHQICDQYKRLDAQNFELLKTARWKSMNAKNKETAHKYEQLRQHYADRHETLYRAFMNTLTKHGERCRAAGLTWSELAREYV